MKAVQTATYRRMPGKEWKREIANTPVINSHKMTLKCAKQYFLEHVAARNITLKNVLSFDQKCCSIDRIYAQYYAITSSSTKATICDLFPDFAVNGGLQYSLVYLC